MIGTTMPTHMVESGHVCFDLCFCWHQRHIFAAIIVIIRNADISAWQTQNSRCTGEMKQSASGNKSKTAVNHPASVFIKFVDFYSIFVVRIGTMPSMDEHALEAIAIYYDTIDDAMIYRLILGRLSAATTHNL